MPTLNSQSREVAPQRFREHDFLQLFLNTNAIEKQQPRHLSFFFFFFVTRCGAGAMGACMYTCPVPK